MSMSAIEKSYAEIARAKPALRTKILEMSLHCLRSDGELSVEDIESVHALCALLRLPINI
jgi:hypothetical protein